MEQISRFAFLIDSRIKSTFFFGKDVKKYLFNFLSFISLLGKLDKLISKSEFSSDIGI